MVQRTVLSKLGIKGDQIKSESGSERTKTTTRTSSHQHPDGKASRGPDLKKKMKKSGSIKRSSTNSLRSFPFGTGIPQPGKPPPRGVRVPDSADETPQKQQLQVRPDDGLPNYMKPTSSSYARKERSFMTPPSARAGSDTKGAARRMSSASSKMGSPSHDNSKAPVKNLKRSSSLRLMRTLTKTTSFKPARSSSAKRCSKVVLCTDTNAQRATCSSTMKDSKFPKYLTLSPGATEAEGTSAVKVCPYTYCSLNGHPRSPLPPLKCFISSRRMAMKAQRSLNSEDLKTDAEEAILVDVPKSMQTDDGRGFFIEIYEGNEDEDLSSHESIPEEEDWGVQEGVDFPCSVSEAAPPVEGFQGHYDSEVECHDSLEEEGSESSDMEWDGDCYLTFALDEAVEHLTEKEDVPETEKPEACHDFLLIHWKNVPDEKVQQGEDEECPEAELPADPVSEICESSQVLDCSSYNQYSPSEGDGLEEVTADGEETAEFLTEELSAEQTESIGIDPTLHKPQRNQDSSTTCLSFEQELEIYSGQPQCLSQEKEDIAVDKMSEDMAGVGPRGASQDLLSDEQQCQIKDVNKSQNFKILDEANEEKMEMIAASEDSAVEEDQKEVEFHAQTSIAEEALLESHDPTSEKSKSKYTRAKRNSWQDSDPSKIWIGKNRCKSLSEEEEDPRRFNPRDPNYLPIVPEPEAEKVDLRHQEMDDRRNSDEWMIDYALRQAVTRLAPARKRKVALLVEAFEKVMPSPRATPASKWETHLTSPRPIQACS